MIEHGLVIALVLPIDYSIEVKVLVKLLVPFVYDFIDQLLSFSIAALEAFAHRTMMYQIST